MMLVRERMHRLSKKVHLTEYEKKKYGMSTDKDYEILLKTKRLEKLKLTKEDRFLVKLIRTQLEHDWRKPLMHTLNKILRKYNRKKGET